MIKNQYLNILVSSAAVYLFIVLAFRLFGKKELSQLSLPDLVFVLLISNAVQNAMVGTDSSLTGGLLAATTLFALNYGFKFLLFRSKSLAEYLEGEPIILVSHGKVNDNNLRKLHISFNELLEAVREHGISDIKEVNLAILEVDGNISIQSDDFKKRSVKYMSFSKKHRKSNHSIID
jgi:uncharacterized membrane protein YcaP (DUF421 family)